MKPTRIRGYLGKQEQNRIYLKEEAARQFGGLKR
jgi:hypothetical protein